MQGKLVSVHTHPTKVSGTVRIELGFASEDAQEGRGVGMVLAKGYTEERVAGTLRAAADALDPRSLEDDVQLIADRAQETIASAEVARTLRRIADGIDPGEEPDAE